jgi:hypothetical protein
MKRAEADESLVDKIEVQGGFSNLGNIIDA